MPGRRTIIFDRPSRRTDDPYDRREWPGWPLPNVHVGVSVEDQSAADLRIPALLATPAAVRFLSCEPLLGPIDLDLLTLRAEGAELYTRAEYIRWVIVGGESGSRARPMDLAWARSIVRQCRGAGVAVFVKQLGSVATAALGSRGKGGVPDAWPADLRVRQMPDRVTAL